MKEHFTFSSWVGATSACLREAASAKAGRPDFIKSLVGQPFRVALDKAEALPYM